MDCIAGADASMSFPSIVILAFSEPWRVNSAELVNNVPVNPVALVKAVVASAIIVVAELIVTKHYSVFDEQLEILVYSN